MFNEVEKILKDKYDLTNLEVNEVVTTVLSVAQDFRRLGTCYKTAYIEETKQLIKAQEKYKEKEGMKKLLQRKPKPSKNVKVMWEFFTKADVSFKEFSSVCMAHNFHSKTGSIEAGLTKVFEILHEKNKLADPEKVMDGRRAYEVLSTYENKKLLLKVEL